MRVRTVHGIRSRWQRSLGLMLVVLLAITVSGVTSVAGPGIADADAAGTTAADADDRGSSAPDTFRRVAGRDRFATAATIARRAFPAGAQTVYIATGEDFPDALAGGPVAGPAGAPILLVGRDVLPDATAAELERIAPDRIVILGGSAAVSSGVADRIADVTGVTPERVSGRDRYATAAAISVRTFEPGVPVVYVATGENFPDALAGGPLAASDGVPILLVGRHSLPETTADELRRLRPGRIVVLGGSVAVSDGVVAELGSYTSGEVGRLAGTHRYETAVRIAEGGFEGSHTAYLATGGVFADALSAAPAAIGSESPVLLVQHECAPDPVGDELARLGASELVSLGGRVALSDRAAAGVPCDLDVDIPEPSFDVDRSVRPRRASLPPRAAGQPSRELGAILDERGTKLDVVMDEVILIGTDETLAEYLSSTGGVRIETVRPPAPEYSQTGVHLIRHDTPPPVDREELGQLVRSLVPVATGRHTASSDEVLDLLGLAAESANAGFTVGLNAVPVGASADLPQRVAMEAPNAIDDEGNVVSGYDRNPFTWQYLNRSQAPHIGVPDAWRALALADRLPSDANRIRVGVLDGGFASSRDYPPGTTGFNNRANDDDCGGAGCPWHGTHTANTVAGLVGNEHGTAGVAGPVATLTLGGWDGDLFSSIARIIGGMNTEIVNMSWSFALTAALAWMVEPLADSIALVAAASGQIQVAAAGNDGENVDQEVFCPFCFEDLKYIPCEVRHVICVGGMSDGSTARASDSNYGHEDVDIWAPFTVYVGPDPDDARNLVRKQSGTSYSAPYVAGVIALIKAADRRLGRGDVIGTLYGTAREGVGAARRYVDAYAAVTTALGGQQPPELEIIRPTPGQEVRRAQNLPLSARASIPGGPEPTVVWRLDGTRIATGRSETFNVNRESVSLGPHTVTATIVHGPYTIRESRRIHVLNTAPTGEILHPFTDDTVCQSCPLRLSARSYDPDEPGAQLRGDQLVWSVQGSDTRLATGSEETVRGSDIGPPGTYWLTLRGTDSQGASFVDAVRIQTEEDPDDLEPIVRITSPGNEESRHVDSSDARGNYTQVTLKATADDPDGPNDKLQGEWEVVQISGSTIQPTPVVVEATTSSPATAKLYNNGPDTEVRYRITFTAREPDGPSGSDSVRISVTTLH